LRCLHTAYVFSGGSSGISQRGFPHSEIPGSKLICSSPGLIAAYRVLHRLLVPRHSPYTLSSLTIRNSTYTSTSPRAFVRPRRKQTCESYAHCVCVVGKNYRLQNIQLSKNPPSPLRGFGVTSLVACHSSLLDVGSPLGLPSRSADAFHRREGWWR